MEHQWLRIEDPEMNPHTYGHFDIGSLTKELKLSSGKKDSIFQQMVLAQLVLIM